MDKLKVCKIIRNVSFIIGIALYLCNYFLSINVAILIYIAFCFIILGLIAYLPLLLCDLFLQNSLFLENHKKTKAELIALKKENQLSEKEYKKERRTLRFSYFKNIFLPLIYVIFDLVLIGYFSIVLFKALF